MLTRLILAAVSLLAEDAPRVLASPQSVEAPAPALAAPVVVPLVVPVVATTDLHGFQVWLNAERAARGLHPLAFDPHLASLAAANSSRGFGHHGFNPGRENVGMGSLGQVESSWLHAAAHAAALFDRGVTRYGIALVNGVWTYNAR